MTRNARLLGTRSCLAVLSTLAGCAQGTFRDSEISREHTARKWMLIGPDLSVYDLRQGKVGTLASFARAVTDVGDFGRWWAARVSPQGSYIALMYDPTPADWPEAVTSEIWIVDVRGCKAIAVDLPDDLCASVHEMAWSPDERSLLCFCWQYASKYEEWRAGRLHLLARTDGGLEAPWEWQPLPSFGTLYADNATPVITPTSWETQHAFLISAATEFPPPQRARGQTRCKVIRCDLNRMQRHVLRWGLRPVSLGPGRYVYKNAVGFAPTRLVVEASCSTSQPSERELRGNGVNMNEMPVPSPDRRYLLGAQMWLEGHAGFASVGGGVVAYDLCQDRYELFLKGTPSGGGPNIGVGSSVWIDPIPELWRAVVP